MRNARYGAVRTLMPYLLQDSYTRSRKPGTLRTAVLDNGILRATVALDLGGRLWSLFDLRSGRELLYRNPVLQPANLALRNAWFAGGVEWNIGTRGHSPTTCSPLHAARIEGPGGVPVLRLYEYERMRDTIFQVDLWLPAGADALRVHVRIRNTTAGTVPVYWWSNTAIGEDVRVLAPADRAFCTSYDGSVRVRAMPVVDGVDRSYPLRNRHAADYFFDTAGVARPWIAAVDSTGVGLAQTSTARLGGRKLFVWGQSTGGRQWVDWLSPGHHGYAEIQAGLAATQYEHLPLPAGGEWSWLETYGPVHIDPAGGHGTWPEAVRSVSDRLAESLSPARPDAELAQAREWADRAPVEPLSSGTGWGALERHRRAAAGGTWSDETGTPFPDGTLGVEQHDWLRLLTDGVLLDTSPTEPPLSYVGGGGSDDDWAARLADLPGWRAAYHRAVLAHGAGEADLAAAGYRESLAVAESAWALCGLALLDRAAGRLSTAAEQLLRGCRLAPDCWQLAVEAGEVLLAADRPADALSFVDSLPDQVRGQGRLLLLEVHAALAAGVPERARELLRAGLTVPDVWEGEVSLAVLWSEAFPDKPVPARYDFRMH